jgi:hypothetical protein
MHTPPATSSYLLRHMGHVSWAAEIYRNTHDDELWVNLVRDPHVLQHVVPIISTKALPSSNGQEPSGFICLVVQVSLPRWLNSSTRIAFKEYLTGVASGAHESHLGTVSTLTNSPPKMIMGIMNIGMT